jgi:hypothetical protein
MTYSRALQILLQISGVCGVLLPKALATLSLSLERERLGAGRLPVIYVAITKNA